MTQFTINCTGNCVVGDFVQFERAVFTGSYRNAKFSHNETVEGEIIRDSYGAEKQQHTFTIQLPNGKTTRIKGRNLYRNGTMRKPWADENERLEALREKHARGDAARAARYSRRGY